MKHGILLNIVIGRNHRFCIRRFWGKTRNGYYYKKSESKWDNGIRAIFRCLTLGSFSFDFITWDRTEKRLSLKGEQE